MQSGNIMWGSQQFKKVLDKNQAFKCGVKN